jgi:hypothetical protein
MWSRTAEPRTALAALLLAVLTAAQQPAGTFVVEVAVAAAPQRTKLQALAWLASDWLAANARWPQGLEPRAAFRLTLTERELRIAPLATDLPRDVVVAGSCTLGDGPPALFRCGVDGSEDWYVPAAFEPPPAWLRRLGDLDAAALDRPRTLATAALVGHLAGALAIDDPRAELLQLGASLCGDVTWLAWATPEGLRVRGRSDGGLLLPAALLLLADAAGPHPDPLAVRAYAARDGDRAEATRQMARASGDDSLAPLRAMLHADDPTRLSAIDALVRRRSRDDLPAIVAAAKPDLPWTTLAAADALRELWPAASPAARQRTRAALARSDNIALRAIDVEALAQKRATADAGDVASARLRALAWLALLATGLTGFWLRERARLRAASLA